MAPIALQRLHPPCHTGANAKALNFRDYLDSYLPLMGQPAKWWRGVPSVVARRRFFFEKKNQKTFVYYGPTCRTPSAWTFAPCIPRWAGHSRLE
jgi:hypothetical protein